MGYSPWVKKSQIQQSDSHTHTHTHTPPLWGLLGSQDACNEMEGSGTSLCLPEGQQSLTGQS